MPDTKLERFYLQRLLSALNLEPERIEKSETPDFILDYPDDVLGIELTRFFLPPPPGERPQQESDSLAQLAVESARRLFRKHGGPARYVTVFFARDPASKNAAYDLGRRLAYVLLEREAGVTNRLRTMTKLPEVADIGVYPSVDGVDELWYPARAGWVAEVQPAHVQAVMDKKSEKAPQCRSRCDHLWLVIAHDVFRNGAPCRVSHSVLEEQYSYEFDKVFWLDAQIPAAHVLQYAA